MIGVAGSNGFVGKAICRKLKSNRIKFKKINRKNCQDFENFSFSIFINSAMPSKRFWAKKYPKDDYRESVLKTKYFIKNFKFKKFIHISSVSSRCQKNTIYGSNKKKSENVVKKLKNYIIYRLGPMYGLGLNKGVLIDLKKSQTVFVNKKSKYSFTNVDWIGNHIVKNLSSKTKNKIIEIGATDWIVLDDLRKKINSKSKFYGKIDNQVIINKRLNGKISSESVIEYIKKKLKS